jgi:hypothetical protein
VQPAIRLQNGQHTTSRGSGAAPSASSDVLLRHVYLRHVEEAGGLITYVIEKFLFGTSELLLDPNNLVDAFVNSSGK